MLQNIYEQKVKTVAGFIRLAQEYKNIVRTDQTFIYFLEARNWYIPAYKFRNRIIGKIPLV